MSVLPFRETQLIAFKLKIALVDMLDRKTTFVGKHLLIADMAIVLSLVYASPGFLHYPFIGPNLISYTLGDLPLKMLHLL